MTTRRFTLPWQRPTRKPGSHLRPRARRTTDAARTSRTGVAAAMALLALTAGTATAVSPLADGTTTADEPSVVTVTPDETPADGASPEEAPTAAAEPSDTTAVAATTALQRAQEVTAESTTLSAKKERRIEAQADEVAELLVTRDDTAASRSAERTPLPVPDPTEESAAGSADEPSADESATADAPAAQETPAAEPEDAEPSPEDGVASTGEASEDELTEATQELTSLLKKAESDVEVEAAPATPAEILAAEKKEAAAAADELAAEGGSTADYANGKIPADVMCELSFAPGEMLRCDAAAQLERLDVAYRAKFGAHLSIRDSYRSYASQVATKAAKGHLAAVPGYSNHGWGVAVDLSGGVESFGTARYEWLRANAPEFGWDNPGWARAGGSKPEAWHWEYKSP